jgi:hypothetical protein
MSFARSRINPELSTESFREINVNAPAQRPVMMAWERRELMVHLGPSPALSRGMSRVRIVTVCQHHLTHVYTKLGLTSRVQLAQVAARHA